MYNFISILIGGLTAIMLTFNGALSQYTGNYISNIIIHLVGLTSLILILIFSKFKLNFKKGIPLIFYTGGAVGVFTVIFNNICITTIGATLTVSLGLLGQVENTTCPKSPKETVSVAPIVVIQMLLKITVKTPTAPPV